VVVPLVSLLLLLGGLPGLFPESRLTSPSMPAPFSAIRDTAASRRRALGAMSSASRNGRGIDVHPCWETAADFPKHQSVPADKEKKFPAIAGLFCFEKGQV